MAAKKSTVIDPQEGEYWYAKTEHGFSFYKIRVIKDDVYYCHDRYNDDYPTKIVKDDFLKRWVPNNLWKLLGYK